ncbi:OmpA family protein [Oceanisphaera sp. W20_SRM_FM3]|uniref:MotY family protein n=1 Tax=Oceanisphaera sp. W20_SRM_FM3 TaxID=3240267 RepID=UPI003F9CAA4D
MMLFTKFRAGLAIGIFLVSQLFVNQQVYATTMTAIDAAKWQFHQAQNLCVLEHKVVELALARFSSAKGGRLVFELKWLTASPQGGQAVLNSRSAPWRDVEAVRLAQGAWQQQMLRFNGAAEAALNALVTGRWLDVTELGGGRQLVLPSVYLQQPYQDFRLCRGEVGVERSADGTQLTLHFQTGAKQLTHNQIQQLNQLAKQVSHQPQVRRLQIDAYTDNSGGAELNLRVSQSRALQVVNQLRRTLSVLPMDMHAHGQALPSSDNNTSAGRYQNRRVTITLLQVEQAL